MTRLETVHEHGETDATPLIFGAAGLISGLVSWLAPSAKVWLTWEVTIGGQTVNLFNQGLVFAVALAAAVFLSGAHRRVECSPANWIAAFVATPLLYLAVVHLLFAGWFSRAFQLPGWLNFGLCGMIGALMMGLMTAAITRHASGGLLISLCVGGAVSGLAGVGALGEVKNLFLFPWWHTVVATVIGLWMAQAGEE
jgi:hypothetical protein